MPIYCISRGPSELFAGKRFIFRDDPGLGLLNFTGQQLRLLMDFGDDPLLLFFQEQAVFEQSLERKFESRLCHELKPHFFRVGTAEDAGLADLLLKKPGLFFNGIVKFEQLHGGLCQFRRHIGTLLQKIHDLRMHADGKVIERVRPGCVSPDVHQVFEIGVGCDQLINPSCHFLMIGIGDFRPDAADALQQADGGKMPAVGKIPVQPQVTIGDAFDGIRDRLIEIIAFDQNGVEARD